MSLCILVIYLLRLSAYIVTLSVDAWFGDKQLSC